MILVLSTRWIGSCSHTEPHRTPSKGQSPAQLLFGRNLRTKLNLLKPDVQRTVNDKLLQDETRAYKHFSKGQQVITRNYRKGAKWICGTLLEKIGPMSYTMLINDRIRKQHADQLRPYYSTGSNAEHHV